MPECGPEVDKADGQGCHTVVEVEKGAGKPCQPAVQKPFPWKGGVKDTFCKWLLTEDFQASLQLAVGTFVVALFTFITALRFRQSCLATIFFVAAMLLVARDAHVGSRLAGSAVILGTLWFGGLLAACVVSLGRAPSIAYPTFLILFTAVALLVTTTLRVKANLGVGVISNLGFGIMLIAGQFVWPARPLWQHTYTMILRIGLVASLGVFIAGLFILPSLAGDDLRLKIAYIMKDLGNIVSDGSGHLLLRKQDAERALQAKGKDDLDRRSHSARALNLMTQEERMDDMQIEHDSHPGTDLRPLWTKEKGRMSLSELRPRLARCREVFAMSAVEPPFLYWGRPYNTFKWPAVLNALDTLVMRVAALESIIEGEDPMMLDGEIKASLGQSLLPAFRLLFAQIAASCASAAKAIRADVDAEKAYHRLLFEPSWAVIEYELASALYKGLKMYWKRLGEGQAKDFITPSVEVRALLYMGTIGNAIMEAMAAFERALKDALHSKDIQNSEKLATPVLEAIRILREAASGPDAINVIRAPPAEPHAVNVMCGREMQQDKTASQLDLERGFNQGVKSHPALISFRRSMDIRPMQEKPRLEFSSLPNAESTAPSPDEAEKPDDKPRQHGHATTAVASKMKDAAKARLLRHFAWAIPLIKAAIAWDVVNVCRELVVRDIPQSFSSPRKIWNTFRRNRWFQFGLKYYAASVIVLGILLALQENYKATRAWNGLYINITIVVVLSEKVDTTFQKGLLRILTTVIGAVLGFLVMLDRDVATNPYGLMAITVCFAAVCGLMALGPLKYAIFLTLITFDGIVLCQYDARHRGSFKNFYTRIVVTVWGVLICLGFDLLFPWYAASSAMQDLGNSFKAAGEIMDHFLHILSEELNLGYLNGADMETALTTKTQGLLRLEKGILQKRIAGPLGGVQISLEKEGVLWKRGTLAMPLIVRQAIQILQAVLDRLAAVELMLLQKPVVSGRYSGAPWHFLHQHLCPLTEAQGEAIVQMCSATCRLMGEFPSTQDLEDLRDAIHHMHQCRMKWRAAYREKLKEYVALICAVPPGEPLIAQRSVDDGIRYQSTMFALSKAMDKLMLLARTVEADPWMQQRVRHPHTWQTWHTWTGNYGYK